ncbi:MAG: hypothetical protein HXY30_04410 [Pseudorhodoplanes sp.]|nr:hypothetical protein [Pseudorhodoplanes sp.]
MNGKVTPERVAAIAAAARVPLRSDAAARIANAVTPAVARFGDEPIALALEIEPATYVVIARGGAKR